MGLPKHGCEGQIPRFSQNVHGSVGVLHVGVMPNPNCEILQVHMFQP